jgi:hypothetical protein
MVEMPDEVAIKALVDGEPFAGAAFNVTLATTKNGLFLLCLERTDARGEVRLSGVDLRRRAAEARNLAMMDYGPLTGDIHVGVLNRADIPNRRHGYKVWGAEHFPDGYLAWLDEVEAILEPVPDGAEMRAVVGVKGGTMTGVGSLRYATTPRA